MVCTDRAYDACLVGGLFDVVLFCLVYIVLGWIIVRVIIKILTLKI